MADRKVNREEAREMAEPAVGVDADQRGTLRLGSKLRRSAHLSSGERLGIDGEKAHAMRINAGERGLN